MFHSLQSSMIYFAWDLQNLGIWIKSVMSSINLFRISIASSLHYVMVVIWVRWEPASYCVLYFQSHFMMLPFCCHFYRVSHQQLDSNKFKDFKTFEYYDIQNETLKLNTLEHRRMKKLDSETKIPITWWKISPGDSKICSI